MPDSVLATAHSLRTLVADSFPLPPTATATPAPHPHPLGASPPPASLPALRAALSSHLSSLRSSLATFSALALPPSPSASQDPTAAGAATGKRETDKYLTLLRDCAQHQAALLAHRTAAAAHLATHRDNDAWPVRVPSTQTRGAVLEALEGIAKELALVAFRDDDGGGEGGAEGTAAEESTKPVTLSVGGKVMVVDFEVRGPANAGEGATVERVKVAYVVDGADRVCDPAAQKLHALLAGPAHHPDERDEQERWKGVRRVLRQLGELDAETERSGRDCFTLLTESLVDELGGALGGAQPAAGAEEGQGSPDLPALLPPSPTSLHPTLHLYSTPLASLLSPSPSSLSPRTPGVYAATISLDLSVPPGTGAGEAEAEAAAPRFVAALDPPVPLSRATGREICEALGLRGSRDSVRDEGEDGGEEADEGWWSATYPSLRPLSLRPVLPSPAPSPPPLVATHLRFSRAAQLVAALGVLRRQVRANEVVWSLLRERERGRDESEECGEVGDAQGKGRRREKKRRKVEAVEREDEGKTMTLDELFATPTAPSALPITLHPSRGSSGGGGGVLFSFPFPPSPTTEHLTGLPLSLSLSPAAVGRNSYRAQLSFPPGVVAHLGGGAERVEALERRVERVLEATGEAGLGMREVLGALETAGEGS
ncbi:uncharacterized protein JCM10292_001736 [Rhodotorula paludigena]|uniref:uncharacterized protein n=1 Tax=Rhodotorula paludigena TaxID=86838 RepID=UPI003182B332